MTRPKWFNLAAGVSLALFVLTCLVWWWAVRTYVDEGDRLVRELKAINAELAHEPWGPDYAEHAKRRDGPGEALAAYRRNEPALRAAEYRKYVVLPVCTLICLAILPGAWIFLAWRRREQRLARRAAPPTRLQRGGNLLFTGLAAISFVLAGFAAWMWVRSYSTSDRFIFSSFVNEAGLTYWRQTEIASGSGSFGFHRRFQSGAGANYRQVIEQMYQRRNIKFPLHRIGSPNIPDIGLGKPRWGFSWQHFENGPAGAPPMQYGYGLGAPLWSAEVVFMIVPLLWLWRWMIRRRYIRSGYCTHCRYDLTGNTTGVCPECGNTAPGKSLAVAA